MMRYTQWGRYQRQQFIICQAKLPIDIDIEATGISESYAWLQVIRAK